MHNAQPLACCSIVEAYKGQVASLKNKDLRASRCNLNIKGHVQVMVLCRTLWPASTHSASWSMALLSLNARSRRRVTSIAASPGLPAWKDGDAMGENSTLKRTAPSLGLHNRRQTNNNLLSVGSPLCTQAVDVGTPAALVGQCEPLAPVLIWRREGRGDDCHDLRLPQI